VTTPKDGFVTKEDIYELVLDERWFELPQLAEKLLAERDAYREVAIQEVRDQIKIRMAEFADTPPNYVDAECARILERQREL